MGCSTFFKDCFAPFKGCFNWIDVVGTDRRQANRDACKKLNTKIHKQAQKNNRKRIEQERGKSTQQNSKAKGDNPRRSKGAKISTHNGDNGTSWLEDEGGDTGDMCVDNGCDLDFGGGCGGCGGCGG